MIWSSAKLSHLVLVPIRELVRRSGSCLVILVRPSLAIINACINYCTRVMDISFWSKSICLDVFNAAMGPAGNKCIFFVEEDEAIDEVAIKVIASIFESLVPYNKTSSMTKDSQETMYNIVVDFENSVQQDVVTTVLHNSGFPNKFELLPPLAIGLEFSSFVSRLVVELKSLSHTLTYGHLGTEESLPVIISSELFKSEEEKLIIVLKRHKRVRQCMRSIFLHASHSHVRRE